MELLIEGLYRRWGYVFRHYTKALLKRRLLHARTREKLPNLTRLLEHILYDSRAAERLVRHISVNFMEMFRDPLVYNRMISEVFPRLATYPHILVWNARCSTGEEVYSLAILFTEAGLYPRCLIYGTDLQAGLIKQACQGIFPLAHMQPYIANYHAAGGREEFSRYYTARYERAVFNEGLKKIWYSRGITSLKTPLSMCLI